MRNDSGYRIASTFFWLDIVLSFSIDEQERTKEKIQAPEKSPERSFIRWNKRTRDSINEVPSTAQQFHQAKLLSAAKLLHHRRRQSNGWGNQIGNWKEEKGMGNEEGEIVVLFISYRGSRIPYHFFLRITDSFPDQPCEKIESIENESCEPVMAEIIIIRPMIGDRDKKDEMDGCC